MSGFRGFPNELFGFFEGLERDNSKSYWEAHRAIWEANVHQPMLQLVAELEKEFPHLRLFRPNRDIRFSKDKSPYRLWAGITSTSRAAGGIGFFMKVQAAGLRLACGAMVLEQDQLERFRAALAHKTHGPQFVALTKQLAAKGLPVAGGNLPPLKRVPSGYPPDHAMAEFLRWKGAIIIKEFGQTEWLHTPKALQKIREVWHSAEPLKDWIDARVGPSQKITRRPE